MNKRYLALLTFCGKIKNSLAVFVLDVRQPVSCVVDVFRIKRDLSGRESVTELELHGMVEEQVSRASTQTLQRLTKAFLREVLMQAGSDL